MSRPEANFPSTPEKWQTMVEQAELADMQIHDVQLPSASKMKLWHFLLLRVLWKSIKLSKFDPADFDLDEWIKIAREMLESYRSWKVFLDSFTAKEIGEGNFFLAKKTQNEAAMVKSDEISDDVIMSPVSKRTRQKTRERREALNQTPTKPPSNKSPSNIPLETLSLNDATPSTPETIEEENPFRMPLTADSLGPPEIRNEIHPKVDDEQVVNIALLNFLLALTEYFSSLSSEWTIHRKAFQAEFETTKYEARTDGYLRGKVSKEVRGLIEVKAPLRHEKLFEIRIQESAQMVAYLVKFPDTPQNLPFRRFHVSQDRHEIYLNFAQYDDNYLKYLQGTSSPTDPISFLTMYEVGPFNTQNQQHMAVLGPILLALTLRADHDRQVEQQMKEQQMKEQQMKEQQMKEQQEKEQQEKEQQEKEQQEKEQQEKEQQEKEQQEKEQQGKESGTSEA